MKRRSSGNRRRKRFRTFWACLGIAALGATPWLLTSGRVRLPATIRALHLSGLARAPSADWREVLGVKAGDPLFGGWRKKSVTRLAEQPRVAAATVARSATGEVFVDVTERKTAALLNAGRLWYVDAEGNVLGPVGRGKRESLDLPVISGPWTARTKPESLRSYVVQAVDLKNAQLAAGVPEREISELHFDGARGWTLYRVGFPAPIVIGTTDFNAKAARVARVLSDLKGREAAVRELDVDFNDRVVVKLEGEKSQKKEM